MTPEELKVIEALANAATPGPWRVDHSGDVVYDEPCVGVVGVAENLSEDDSAFIAAARAAVPALTAELRNAALNRVMDAAEMAVLREDNARLKVQLDGSFGGISRNKIHAMGREAALMQVDAALATLAHARDSAGGLLSRTDFEEFIANIRASREVKT